MLSRFATILVVLWHLSVMATAAEFPMALPTIAAPDRVSIFWQETSVAPHVPSIRFRFRTDLPLHGNDPHGVSQGFEKQLTAQGWYEVEAITSNNVFASAWRRASGGPCYLLFSIFQPKQHSLEFFGSIELVPDFTLETKDAVGVAPDNRLQGTSPLRGAAPEPEG